MRRQSAAADRGASGICGALGRPQWERGTRPRGAGERDRPPGRVANPEIVSGAFKDGFFPYQGAEVKAFFEGLKTGFNPDIIFTHRRDDAHQDHRVVAELTWNTFRDHLILEYEIPKYEGDLGAPNIFISLSDATEATYLMSQVYTPGTDRGARHDDPAFAITWPIAAEVVSDKDQHWLNFESV